MTNSVCNCDQDSRRPLGPATDRYGDAHTSRFVRPLAGRATLISIDKLVLVAQNVRAGAAAASVVGFRRWPRRTAGRGLGSLFLFGDGVESVCCGGPQSSVGCGVRGRPSVIASPGSLQRHPARTGITRRQATPVLGIGALPRAPGDHPKPASPPPWSPLPRARGSPADDRRTGIDTQPFPARAGVTRRQATPPLGIGALPRTPRDHPPPRPRSPSPPCSTPSTRAVQPARLLQNPLPHARITREPRRVDRRPHAAIAQNPFPHPRDNPSPRLSDIGAGTDDDHGRGEREGDNGSSRTGGATG